MVIQGQLGTSISIVIARSTPGLASADGTGAGGAAAQVIRLRADGTQEAPVAVTTTPIQSAPGDRLFLVLYGTALRHAGTALSCSMNGQAIPVLYSGAHTVYTGLDQVNRQIPPSLRGSISIACAADDQISNPVTVSIQ